MSRERLLFLQIHPKDNVLVALQDLATGTKLNFNGKSITLLQSVAAKHKFTIDAISKDQEVYM